MSELLQEDDPDPDPYPISYEQSEALPTSLGADEASEARILTLDERAYVAREAVARLSSQASAILDSEHGVGPQTARRAKTNSGELRRSITEGSWVFSFIDTSESQRCHRTWALGDAYINVLSRGERRHELAEETSVRLEALFAQDTQITNQPIERPRQLGALLKRVMSLVVAR